MVRLRTSNHRVVRSSPHTLSPVGEMRHMIGPRQSNKALTLLLLILALAACSFINPCENKILERISAPKDPWEAVVFERDCGATTSTSIQVSILPLGWHLPNNGGNVFIADRIPESTNAQVHVDWLSNRHMEVTYPAGSRVFKSEAQVKHVRVTYKERDIPGT